MPGRRPGREDPLATYRRKRDAARTPEPVPVAGPVPAGEDDTFVIQEHHASSLHWDLRLERAGVLVSWAVPRGIPQDPATNHLAVHTEDHPLEYAEFSGTIPAGEYGGGAMTIWDAGTYVTEKWRDDEVMVVLSGRRVSGRYVLFRTDGKNWMIHRMDPPADPGRTPMPDLLRPMLAVAGELPSGSQESGWAFEMKWDGVRAVVYVSGGRARVLTRNDRDVSGSYPELGRMAASLGVREVVLDGEIVALDPAGRPSFGLLQQRMHVTGATRVRELARTVPVSYLAFDLLYLDGHLLTGFDYDQRRSLLEALDLAGPRWGVPPAFSGHGAEAVEASLAQGLEGVVAKRRSARYDPGRRSAAWLKVKNIRTQEVVIGGWRPGSGNREGTIGALLVGVPRDGALVYAGRVGTGFSAATLADLLRRLRRLERATSPFGADLPRVDSRGAVWVTPRLVGEVAFGEWTPDGRLRHPSWRGLRPDKSPADVAPE